MRRLTIALSVLAVVCALVVPAVAGQGQPDPLGEIAEFFQTKAGQDYAAQFIAGSANSGIADPTADLEHSTGEDPGYTPMHIDINQAWSLNFDDGGAGFFGPTDQNTYWNPEGGPLQVDLPSGRMLYTLRGDMAHDGSQYDNGAVLFGMFVEDTPPVVPQARCEFVVWLHSSGFNGSFENHPNFPRDPAGGTNLALGMGLNPEGDFPSGMFALVLNEGGGFTYDPMVDLRGFISENYVGILAPRDLVVDITAINFYSFCSSTGSYASEESGADQTGLVDISIGDFGQVSYSIAVETTTTTTTPQTTTTTAAPSGGGGQTDGGTTDQGEGDTGSGSMLPIVFTVLGVVVVGGGYWLYTRTRERTPGSVTSTTQAHHTQCDWALYFNSGGTRVNLRPAQGHECCVYDVEIEQDIPLIEEAQKGRQDDDNPQGEDRSPDERLRMFDWDGWSSGPNAGAYAATRTGPFGTQDWMQGLGDPRFEAGWKSTDEGEQHIQHKPLEEPVDAGLSIRYETKTTLKATLTPGCPDYENEYELQAESDVEMVAGLECTNGEPGPECPVELSASGILDASVSGDLNYDLVIKAASYPDELERKAPNAPEGPVGGIDSHDHATRPRSDWEDSQSNSGSNTVKQDATTFDLTTLVHIDSGQIVPMEVWDTTERVTTDIGGSLYHKAGISGRMTTDCTDGCGGHGKCLCAPEFELNIDGGKGKLVVDGETYDIEAPWLGTYWFLS